MDTVAALSPSWDRRRKHQAHADFRAEIQPMQCIGEKPDTENGAFAHIEWHAAMALKLASEMRGEKVGKRCREGSGYYVAVHWSGRTV
jgi:hypothetical protein